MAPRPLGSMPSIGTDPPPSMRVREGSIDAFRWICIMAVLVQHSIYPDRQSPETVATMMTLKEWASWCVSGFFMVSGWLANPRDAGWSGFKTRAGRLMKPFVGVNLVLLVVLIGFALTGLPLPGGYDPLNPTFLMRQVILLQGFGPQFYFLPLLLIVGSAVLLLVRLVGRPAAMVVSAIAAGVVFQQVGAPVAAYGGEFILLPYYALSFSIGMVLRASPRSRIAWCLVGVGLVGGVWMSLTGGGSAVFFSFVSAPLFFLVRFAVRGAWHALGAWSSGALYLWHAPLVMTACSMAWAKVGLLDGPGIAVTWVSTVVVCQLVHMMASRTRFAAYLTL